MTAVFPIVMALLALATLLTTPPATPASQTLEASTAPPAPAMQGVVDDLIAVDEPAGPALMASPPVYFMPVDGVKVADVPETFGDPRGADRTHQGVDIIADRGTPVRSAAPGVVWRASDSRRGGVSVTVIGDDGLRYFYTHLDSIAAGVEKDVRVGTDTVLGYVGNTGNAASTAPHLHFEVSLPVDGEPYSWRPIDPLTYMLDR